MISIFCFLDVILLLSAQIEAAESNSESAELTGIYSDGSLHNNTEISGIHEQRSHWSRSLSHTDTKMSFSYDRWSILSKPHSFLWGFNIYPPPFFCLPLPHLYCPPNLTFWMSFACPKCHLYHSLRLLLIPSIYFLFCRLYTYYSRWGTDIIRPKDNSARCHEKVIIIQLSWNIFPTTAVFKCHFPPILRISLHLPPPRIFSSSVIATYH